LGDLARGDDGLLQCSVAVGEEIGFGVQKGCGRTGERGDVLWRDIRRERREGAGFRMPEVGLAGFGEQGVEEGGTGDHGGRMWQAVALLSCVCVVETSFSGWGKQRPGAIDVLCARHVR
jgi:hypothetical protein